MVDPLSEKWNNYSPYNYTLNNPISFIDPDGRDVYEKTTKYSTDKDGNEHKKRKISFRRTTRIDREIEVTNFQVKNISDIDATEAELKEAGELIKEEIISTWSVKDRKKRRSKKVISVNVSKTEEKKSENDAAVVVEFRNPEDLPEGGGIAVPNGNKMSFSSKIYLEGLVDYYNGNQQLKPEVRKPKQRRLVSHEFGHMGGRQHPIIPRSGIMTNPRYPAQFRDYFRIFRGRKKIL